MGNTRSDEVDPSYWYWHDRINHTATWVREALSAEWHKGGPTRKANIERTVDWIKFAVESESDRRAAACRLIERSAPASSPWSAPEERFWRVLTEVPTGSSVVAQHIQRTLRWTPDAELVWWNSRSAKWEVVEVEDFAYSALTQAGPWMSSPYRDEWSVLNSANWERINERLYGYQECGDDECGCYESPTDDFAHPAPEDVQMARRRWIQKGYV